MKKIGLLLSPALTVMVLSGCYTQFAMVNKTPPAPPKEQVEWVIDSTTGDTVKVIKQTDTIHSEDRQTCIWERDLMGYPHLRCYDSFYPRDWFYYNYSPWWYRNDPYWYDYDRCPRSYYYDPSCGCCRYSSDYYHHNGRRYYGREGIRYEKSEPAGPSGSSTYPRTRGIPNPQAGGVSGNSHTAAPAGDKSAATGPENRSSGEIVIPAHSDDKPSIRHERSRGVPEYGTGAAPAETHQSSPQSTSASSGGGSSAAPSPSQPPAKSGQSVTPSSGNSTNPPQNSGKQGGGNEGGQQRRRPRSW